MTTLNLTTKEPGYTSELFISEADNGLIRIDTWHRIAPGKSDQYTRMVIDKEQAEQVIEHFRKEFGL